MLKIASAISFVLLLNIPGYTDDVNASWDPNSESDLAGYRIYYGTQSGSYNTNVDAGNATSVEIKGLQTNTTYYFAATAYDVAGNESTFSQEVSLFIPPPSDTQAPTAPKNVKVVISTSSN